MAAQQFTLTFGFTGRFSGSVDAQRLAGIFQPPAPVSDLREAVATAAANPTDFPPLHQGLVPGDRVRIVLDRTTPDPASVIAGLYEELQKRDVAPADITILQPASYSPERPADPRTGLPEAIRGDVRWVLHDPLPEDSCTYLATTADGERIYLSRELVDADVTILVGPVVFDTLWGYRGLQSLIYPGLSNVETLKKAHGQPHEELQSDSSRPLRQKADEVAWLLGIHFAVGLVPGEGGGVSQVFAGPVETVLKQSREALNAHWKFRPREQPELVLIAVDRDGAGHNWDQLATALQTARSIVAKDGKIGVLTELNTPLTDGLQLIRDARKPRDAMRPLREQSPPDLAAATAFARAVEWANVYLLSRLDPDLVEDMFMVPLGGLDEVQRLIGGEDSIAILGSGQNVCAEAP